jgi:sugar/nucleoside kinase (ribokinase family)
MRPVVPRDVPNGRIDVTGIGNAIVDVLAHADDGMLMRCGLVKGTMALVDESRAASLYAQMAQAIEVSGGSVANTVAGVASLGGRAAYIGKVHADQLGAVFTHDIRSAGVSFDTQPLLTGAPTARSLILVTPDAQRTMNTFLGACREFGPADIDEGLIRRSKVVYIEGYLWDAPAMGAAFAKVARIAADTDTKLAISLSDPFCVDRHRSVFLDLLAEHVDLVFANEHEICALYQVDRLDDAIGRVRQQCEIAAVTRSEVGSIVIVGPDTYTVPAERVARVVDTTGAGDLYAAGFLHAYTRGLGPVECGRLGSLCAAEIISHVGARPERPLRALFASDGAPPDSTQRTA